MQRTSRIRLSFTLGTLLLAGCAPSFVHDGGIVWAQNPFGVPDRVTVQMPNSLTNYPSTAAYRTQATDGVDATAHGVKDNIGVYLFSTGIVNNILQAVGKAHPNPGQSYTFPDPNHPGTQLTVLLTVKSDHAVIAIGQGPSATGDNQLLAISYTSPRKGTAVFHALSPDPSLGKFYLRTVFDLDQGHVSADGASDNTAIATGSAAQKFMGHWEFSDRIATGSPATFSMLASVFIDKPSDTQASGVYAITSKFLADGSGAYLMGVQNGGTSDVFHLVPTDGVSWTDPSASHAFYMTAQGTDLAAASASADLQSIVPASGSFYTPFPTDPAKSDPFSDPRFAFPQ